MSGKQRHALHRFLGAALCIGASDALAGVTFDITKVVDFDTEVPGLDGITFDLVDGVTMSVSAGRVAFVGRADIFAAERLGVYLWHDGELEIVADSGMTAPESSEPLAPAGDTQIDGDIVAFDSFLGRFGNRGTGVYARVDGLVTRIADSTQTLPGAAGPGLTATPRLAGETVVFWNKDSAGEERLYSANLSSGEVGVVLDEFTADPEASAFALGEFDGERAAFRAAHANGLYRGVYTTDLAGDVVTIARAGDPIPGGAGATFFIFGGLANHPSVDGGIVAFTGLGGGIRGIYTAPTAGGPLSIVFDSTMTLPGGSTAADLTAPAISDGNVAFFGGSMFDGGYYVRWEGVIYEVVHTGDRLEGRTIQSLVASPFGFDGRDLAFGVRFTDNTDAIYLAHIIPSPSPALLLGAPAMFVLTPRRRRSPPASSTLPPCPR